MIWCRVNAIKLLQDPSFSFRDLGLKSVASPVRERRCIWSHNCDINHNQTVKSENVRIVKSSVNCQRLSPNLLHKRGFVTSLMQQTEVSWSQMILQQTLCKQFEVSRYLRIYFGRRRLFCVSDQDMSQWQGHHSNFLDISAAKTFLLLKETMQCKWQ